MPSSGVLPTHRAPGTPSRCGLTEREAPEAAAATINQKNGDAADEPPPPPNPTKDPTEQTQGSIGGAVCGAGGQRRGRPKGGPPAAASLGFRPQHVRTLECTADRTRCVCRRGQGRWVQGNISGSKPDRRKNGEQIQTKRSARGQVSAGLRGTIRTARARRAHVARTAFGIPVAAQNRKADLDLPPQEP